MGNVWALFGQCLAMAWPWFGQCLVMFWALFTHCLGIVWVDLADSKTFDGICVDLGWDDLKGLRYSEDRSKLIFEGLGRFLWIRVKMATDLDGSRKIWMTLSGFDWIWGIWSVFGRRYVSISKFDFVGYSRT